jgi:alpha-L-rhamnosidase
MLTAEMVNTDMPVSAQFKSSNPLFDRINTNWQRCILDNTHGCVLGLDAHRERCPYTGDGQVVCVATMHNFDAAAFYVKWMRDMRDAQNAETGYVTNTAPWQSGCGGGVPWGAAMNIIPWEHYVHYGDKKALEDNYFAMKEQVRYMLTWLTGDGTMYMQKENLNKNKSNYWFNLGDWSPPHGLPADELVHTFYLWYGADFTAKAARVLNRQDDISYYSAIADEVKKAFHKKFYDVENKTYGDFGSNIYALVMGVPQAYYDDVVQTLRREVVEKNDSHLNTGIFGTRFFFECLAAHGMNEVAYEAMNKHDFPSFGHWMDQGTTVMWEQWDGGGSRNHPMFGGGFNWFYRTLAGVNTDENEPAYKHILIKPDLPKKMDYAFYSNMTPYGKVVSEVKKNSNNSMELNITIPVGSYATVYIPVTATAVVTESGQPVQTVAGIEDMGIVNDCRVLKAMQGSYHFAVQ